MKPLGSFVGELFRRKVVRLVGAYVVILWALIQGLETVWDIFDLQAWMLQLLIYTGLAMIPVLAWASWKYDLTPPQLVKDTKDVAAVNPGLSWAMRRHDSSDAGFILLKWNIGGEVKEKRFFKAVAIGRGLDNDIDFPDERVSRHHAVLWAEEGLWRIKDLESANGTFLNQAPVSGTADLPQSCDLRFHPNGPILNVFIDKPAETMVS